MVDSTRGSAVEVYAQNMHHADSGAFTGEVAPPMLVELEIRGVVLGHSERRGLFGETDKALALKVPAALQAGLVPILCVGESEEERDQGDTERKLRQQIKEDLAGVPGERLAEVVVAYSRFGPSAPAAWRNPSRSRMPSLLCARSCRTEPAPPGAARMSPSACGSCTAARSSRRTPARFRAAERRRGARGWSLAGGGLICPDHRGGLPMEPFWRSRSAPLERPALRA